MSKQAGWLYEEKKMNIQKNVHSFFHLLLRILKKGSFVENCICTAKYEYMERYNHGREEWGAIQQMPPLSYLLEFMSFTKLASPLVSLRLQVDGWCWKEFHLTGGWLVLERVRPYWWMATTNIPADVDNVAVINVAFPHGLNALARTQAQSHNVEVHHLAPLLGAALCKPQDVRA